ncbi:MAG: SocA family protein [Nitrospirae bacterium]|nr:SocA family protein [Nitrospirota bacterium]MBF0591620.1 SocA family protein [Nitrospirota bacterium]
MIPFKFNQQKSTHVAALFIECNGGTINYIKLIKLLYLADREALNRWERPLTGDSYVLTSKGPVLSNIYDLIRYAEISSDATYWYTRLSRQDDDVSLKQSPQTCELSQRELDLVIEIDKKYKPYDSLQMIEICQRDCSECKNTGEPPIPITADDILKTFNKTDEEINNIAEDIAEINYLDSLIGSITYNCEDKGYISYSDRKATIAQ